MSPKSIFEAEQIAVRMEAHRLADRQRSRVIGSVHESSENVTQVTATPNTTQNKPYLNKPPSNPHFQDQKRDLKIIGTRQDRILTIEITMKIEITLDTM